MIFLCFIHIGVFFVANVNFFISINHSLTQRSDISGSATGVLTPKSRTYPIDFRVMVRVKENYQHKMEARKKDKFGYLICRENGYI